MIQQSKYNYLDWFSFISLKIRFLPRIVRFGRNALDYII
jgi:hypothetical protein